MQGGLCGVQDQRGCCPDVPAREITRRSTGTNRCPSGADQDDHLRGWKCGSCIIMVKMNPCPSQPAAAAADDDDDTDDHSNNNNLATTTWQQQQQQQQQHH
eukprot:2617903-Rhodomonas_salina.3